MNQDRLKTLLVDNGILLKESTSDFICSCPVCGDHPDEYKRGHMYISKNSKFPFAHCFLCKYKRVISSFVKLLTGDSELAEEILPRSELDQIQHDKVFNASQLKHFELPKLDPDKFSNKIKYLTKRTDGKYDVLSIPNLILDLNEFIRINNIELSQRDQQWIDLIHEHHVIFLSAQHTKLFCRACDDIWMKFRKMSIQDMPYDLMDYYCIPGDDETSYRVVLSEGIFDILGELSFNSLELKSKTMKYVSGQSFSYSSTLRSICFFEGLYKADVVILSDRDKKEKDYQNFIKSSSHVINSLHVFFNRAKGGDFGSFPIDPFEVKLKSPTRRHKYVRTIKK